MRLILFATILLTQLSTAYAVVGEVSDLEGQPYLFRKFKKVQLSVGATLEAKDNIYTKDGSLSLKMKDGSTVDLGPQSHFKVKSYNPNESDRNVVLFKGDSRFNIKPLTKTKEEAFLVRTPTAVVGVRGTDFNVGVEGAESTTVTVFEGTVACYSVFGETQSAVSTLLTEGFQSKVSKGKNPSPAKRVSNKEMQSIKSSTSADQGKDQEAEEESEASNEAPAPTEASPIGPDREANSPIDSIREDTLERIQETVAEDIKSPDSSIFDEITPNDPPSSQE